MEDNDFNPKWDSVHIEPDTYIWCVAVEKVTFRDRDKEKPYMQVDFKVIEGDQAGFAFDNRVYVNKKAEWRARWFLKKFDYPADLLEGEQPVLRNTAIEGLQGKILAIVEVDNYGILKVDVKKFDHLNGTEIEEAVAKEKAKEAQMPLTGTTDAEPTKAIDVEADVKNERTTSAAPAVEDDLTLLD